MASPVTLPRNLLIFALAIPLALVVGYMLTGPLDFTALAVLGFLSLSLCLPALLRSHQTILLFACNAVLVFNFLPGRLPLWQSLTLISLAIGLFSRLLIRHHKTPAAPWISSALLALAAVVLLTSKIHGGMGLRIVGGSTYGGKSYFDLLLAIMLFFALSQSSIPAFRAPSAVALFFLAGLTAAAANLVQFGGSAIHWLAAIFPQSANAAQTAAGPGADTIQRLGGFGAASQWVFLFLLARHGIREILALNHPLRLAVFVLAAAGATLGGFRSMMLFMVGVFVMQFLFEGLVRTKLFPLFLGLGMLILLLMIPLASHLPLNMQRAVSFLPVEVDPIVQRDVTASTNWRLEMWRVMLPELHNYLLIGKGYVLNPTDLYLSLESMRRGLVTSSDASILTGSYHNGLFSVFVPLGSAGLLAFLVFLGASLRALYLNFEHGEAALKRINTTLLAMFATKMTFFFLVFGALETDLCAFTAIVGFSVALNGGVRKAADFDGVGETSARPDAKDAITAA